MQGHEDPNPSCPDPWQPLGLRPDSCGLPVAPLGATRSRPAVRALVAAAAADHDRPARAARRRVLLIPHRGEFSGLGFRRGSGFLAVGCCKTDVNVGLYWLPDLLA